MFAISQFRDGQALLVNNIENIAKVLRILEHLEMNEKCFTLAIGFLSNVTKNAGGAKLSADFNIVNHLLPVLTKFQTSKKNDSVLKDTITAYWNLAIHVRKKDIAFLNQLIKKNLLGSRKEASY